MKNTQKKLKAKHFRYLSREYVKDPDRFLKEVVHQWGLDWSNNFNYLINSSIYPPMRTDLAFEYGFVYNHLAQMLEVAYVIFKKCELRPIQSDRLFHYSCQEMFDAEIEGGRIFPEKALRTFFGFKNLKQWWMVLDDLLQYRVCGASDMDGIQLDSEYIAVREFLVKLPKVLREIYDRGGLQFCLETYAGGIDEIRGGERIQRKIAD